MISNHLPEGRTCVAARTLPTGCSSALLPTSGRVTAIPRNTLVTKVKVERNFFFFLSLLPLTLEDFRIGA